MFGDLKFHVISINILKEKYLGFRKSYSHYVYVYKFDWQLLITAPYLCAAHPDKSSC